jgi:pyruvate,water dikinase
MHRDAFLSAHQHPCPNIIRDGEEIFGTKAGTDEVGASGLHGIAGSPGVVTGVTRIIKSPEEFTRLKKGEILVAPITNPVWTPLFSIASAVITEVGGILSHGAIVAREYGIPAVMSVAGATLLLHDGQRITVDGNKGLIYLEQEA